MRTINITKAVDDSKVNPVQLSVLLWCAFIIIFDGYDLVVYGAVVPSLIESWSLKPSVIGYISSLTLFGGLIGAPVCGILADKIGRKKIIITCVALFGLFTLLSGLANGPVEFAVYRFIAGLGLGGVAPLLVALTTEYSPKSSRSMMVAIMFSGTAIGGILVALLGMKVIPTLGWQWMFYIGALPLLSIPFLIKFLPESLAYYAARGEHEKVRTLLKKLNPSFSTQQDDTYEVHLPKAGMPVVKLFEEKRGTSTVMFCIICLMTFFMIYGFGTWLPQLMVKAGYPLTSSLMFLVALNIGGIIGAISGGWLADRIGPKPVLISTFSLGAICLFLLVLNPGSLILYFLIAVAGAGSIGSQILVNGYVSKFYPTHIRTTALGFSTGIGRIGAILGPAIVGILLELSLPAKMNFIIFAIPAFLAAVAIWFVVDKQSDFNKIEDDASKNNGVQQAN